MDNQKPGVWWKLANGRQGYQRPEVVEHEAEIHRRKTAAIKHPRYWLHLIGMALLMTQSKLVIAARGTDGNIAWVIGILAGLAAGVLVAGIWHAIKRPTIAQTGRHVVIVSWAVIALAVFGSYQ